MAFFGGKDAREGREGGTKIPNDLASHIHQLSSLQSLPNANQAQELLSRASKAVFPLLQRRKWKIGHLTEFYPPNPSLHGLNINKGSVIKVRLRTSER